MRRVAHLERDTVGWSLGGGIAACPCEGSWRAGSSGCNSCTPIGSSHVARCAECGHASCNCGFLKEPAHLLVQCLKSGSERVCTCKRFEGAVLMSPVRMTFAMGGGGEARTEAAWMMLAPRGRGCGPLGSTTMDDDDVTCTTDSSFRFIIGPGHRFGSLDHKKNQDISKHVQQELVTQGKRHKKQVNTRRLLLGQPARRSMQWLRLHRSFSTPGLDVRRIDLPFPPKTLQTQRTPSRNVGKLLKVFQFLSFHHGESRLVRNQFRFQTPFLLLSTYVSFRILNCRG